MRDVSSSLSSMGGNTVEFEGIVNPGAVAEVGVVEPGGGAVDEEKEEKEVPAVGVNGTAADVAADNPSKLLSSLSIAPMAIKLRASSIFLSIVRSSASMSMHLDKTLKVNDS